MSADHQPPRVIGRGAQIAPPNRFETTHLEDDWEHLEGDPDLLDERRIATEFLPDSSKSIITENNSPDVPFRYSMNPYRGCEHGCAYCYARPTHELLGLNAGLDFESRILVKHDAPSLLRAELNNPRWQPEVIVLSGVTDCYQPAERRYRLTRGLLEVLLEARQPCGIITKNALILRDFDLLQEMARRRLVHANLSITTLNAELARVLEPRTSPPANRLRAVRTLADAGVPARVMVAPVIPGLNDEELPAILAAAAEAGAQGAGYVLLRLPHAVRPVFQDWLARNRPEKQGRVESLIRSTRGGKLNSAAFGKRMRGQGSYAEQISQTFRVFAHQHGLNGPLPELDATQFRPPRPASGQLPLF
ncbi:MAG: PA0069 family radical SAM protein [Planctomycetes bacterium]|nr:PA0069 family radical SAM protein [Planctomycetota bacterium]